jgi:hypothetical protein
MVHRTDKEEAGWLGKMREERGERREERMDWWRSLTFFSRRHRGAVQE